MNEQDITQTDTPGGEVDFDPFAVEKKPRSSGAKGIAWLAFLLALSLAAWQGWQWWQARGGEDSVSLQARELQAVRDRQAELGRSADALQGRLDELAGADTVLADQAAEIDRMKARMERENAEEGIGQQRLDALESGLIELHERVVAMEAATAALAVRGEAPGKRIELAEVDFLLRTATERLRLFGDVRGAGQALELADRQLTALDDPLYLPVRQAIAAAQLELEALPQIDIVGLTQGLARLQAGIPALPFPGEVASSASVDPVEADGEEPGIWERFKATLSSLVTVRRRVEDDQLMSLEDESYVRQGLWLQLESARLASMRADQATYGSSLQRANSTLEQYFDPGHRNVVEASVAIDTLAAAQVSVVTPDISLPWAQLNRLRNATAEPPPLPAIQDQAVDGQAGDSDGENTP